MRIGYVVDAGCDLPQAYVEKENIVILPIAVRIGEQVINDNRQESVSQQFLDSGLAKEAAEAETIPYTVDQISDLFLQKLVVDYDYVMVQTIMKTRSPIYERCSTASFKILNDYHAIRESAGHHTPFNMRVVDTGSLFSGQALVAVEAVRLRDANTSAQSIRNRIDRVVANTHAMLVAQDLKYIRTRARAKGDRSVGLLSAALGTALDIKPLLYANQGETKPVAKYRGFDVASEKMIEHVIAACERGLLTPIVTAAYGGDLDEMRRFPSYDKLQAVCQARGIQLVESIMSLTGIINTGPGTFSLAYAQEGKQTFS